MTHFSSNRANRTQRRQRLIQQLWQVFRGGRIGEDQQRRRKFAVERLEDRRVLAYSVTLVGNVATFVGDGNSEAIRVDSSAINLLRHNRFIAGDPGFADEFDFDSFTAGSQTLSASSTSQVQIDTGAGDDSISIGSNLFPASSMFASINVFAGGAGDSLVVNDSTNILPNAFVSTSNSVVGTGVNVQILTVITNGRTLRTGTANDTVQVDSTFVNEPLVVESANGSDIVTIGNATSGTNNIAAPVHVQTSSGQTKLIVNDGPDATARTLSVNSSTIAGLAPANITYLSTSLSELSIQLGTNNDVVTVQPTSIKTSILGGNGDDQVIMANSASINGGTLDGQAGSNTIDYSNYTTSIAANLGMTVSGLSGALGSEQEVPPNSNTATGSATITNYNPVTKTFDIQVTVSDLNPTLVTGFHIHRGTFGLNGPIIVDFTAGPLVASGTGFTFTKTGVTLTNPQDEAALLGGATYLNVHTAAFPSGIIRGQLFPGTFSAAQGNATGVAFLNNFSNVIGSSAADGIVGNGGTNTLDGRAGNDFIIAGQGNDTLLGGNDNDVLVWSNGDNSDTIDGQLGSDIVVVNGANTAGDNFSISANGSRVSFQRLNLVPFTLDIGTAERLTVNGSGGSDSMLATDLAGVADLTNLDLNGQAGDDAFNVAGMPASTALVLTVRGGLHTVADVLSVDALGSAINNTGSSLTSVGKGPIQYFTIENVNINNASGFNFAGTLGNDTFNISRASATQNAVSLNGAPPILVATGIPISIDGLSGGDTTTIQETAFGLPDFGAGSASGSHTNAAMTASGRGPASVGLHFTGGGNPNDTLRFNLINAHDVAYFSDTADTANSGVVNIIGSLTASFEGLAPIIFAGAGGSLTVDASANPGLSSLGILDDPADLAGAGGNRIVGNNFFETAFYRGFNNLTVRSGGGTDTLTLFTLDPASTETTYVLDGDDTLSTDNSSDGIFIFELPATATALLLGGGGDDTLNLGGISLDTILGVVTVQGEAGNDHLTISDFNDTSNNSYVITNTQVTRNGLPINYDATVENVLISGSAFGNTFQFNSTAINTVYTIGAGAGADTIQVGPTLNDIDGRIQINPEAGVDTLNVSDVGDVAGDSYSLTLNAGRTELTFGDGADPVDIVYNFSGFQDLENLNLTLSNGGNTVTLNNTTATIATTLSTGNGNDTVTIAGSNLVGNNLFSTNDGVDQVNLNITTNLSAPLSIDAGLAAGVSNLRDQVSIQDTLAGRNITFNYENAPIGTMLVGGLVQSLNLLGFENVVYLGNGAFAAVDGTSGTDDITVASQLGAATVFLNGNPWDGPIDGSFGAALPGVAGGSTGPDLLLRGLNTNSFVNVSGGGGLDDQVYSYASSEADLIDPANPAQPVFRGVGLGNGVLIPGQGVGAAYDFISATEFGVSISNSTIGTLVGVSLSVPANFAQSNPMNKGLIVNAGFEAAPALNGIADYISATLSATFGIQINGGDPLISFAPNGDLLQLFTPSTAQVYSDKIGNVTITSPGFLGITTSSIERNLVTPGNGMVQLLGDNNNPLIDQPDHYVVVGQDVDQLFFGGDADGANEFSLRINGDTVAPNAPALYFRNVEFLDTFGADATGADLGAIDTLEVTPYADNTPRGWGIAVTFDEDEPTGTDGNQADLLILHTSLMGGAVSENIVIQPTQQDAGEVTVTSKNFGTPIVNIAYVANTDIIVSDDDGFTTDTDTLTLRGTNPDQANGLSGDNLVRANFTAAGDAANPLVEVFDGLTLLYRLRTNPLPGAAPLTFNTISMEGLAGQDAFSIIGRDDGTLKIKVDGGSEPGQDFLSVEGTPNLPDTVEVLPDVVSANTAIVVQRANATARTYIDVVGIDGISFNAEGGATGDALVVNGSNGVDTMQLTSASPTAGTISMGGSPIISYQNLGTTNSIVLLRGTPVSGAMPDQVLINGTTLADQYTWTPNSASAGTVQHTSGGVTSAIRVENVGSLQLNARDDNDTLSVATTNATITPSSIPGAGLIEAKDFNNVNLLPLNYANTETVTVTGGTGVIVATEHDDLINLNNAGVISIVNAFGFSNQVNVSGFGRLVIQAAGGDDRITIAPSGLFANGVSVIGGDNGNGSDRLAVTGSNTTLSLGLKNITGVLAGPVSFDGIEHIAIDASNQPLTIRGTDGADTVEATPSGANAGDLVAGPNHPSIHYTNVAANTLLVNLQLGNDELKVNATSNAEAITVDVAGGFVDTGALGGIVNFLGGNIEALSVAGRQGNDTFTVTPGATPVFIDGGDPIGTLPGDHLVVNGAVGFFAGPESDEGGVLTAGGTVSFDHIESLVVAAIAGCPMLILGTNADDEITLIARDASTHLGADGVQDLTFSINQGPNVLLLNQADIFVDGLSGDDDIVVRAAAPNEADWDVNLRIAGGSPSSGQLLDSDRLALETPNLAGGFDRVIFNPTGNDTGNIVLDENNTGLYEAAGTDSLITMDSFVFNCPPAAFIYTSSAGGIEWVQYQGEGAPAVDDDITINGTALDDLTDVFPAGTGSGTFDSAASPKFSFQSFDRLTVQSGTSGYDRINIVGTVGNDVVTSTANTITLGGEVTLGAGIDEVTIDTRDGNDNVDLDLTLAGLKKVVQLGSGNDTTNLAGVAIDPADPVIYGGDGDDVIVGSPNIDWIYAGSGNDILIGAGGADQIYGEDGNDIFGNPSSVPNGVADDAGNDTYHGGSGSDIFVWEPGDGSDTIEGGAGDADQLLFFGSGANETFNVFAKVSDPSRAILFRNAGNITMDMAGVDSITVTGNAGSDSYVVGRSNNGDSGDDAPNTTTYVDPTATLSDLSTTEVRVVSIVEGLDAPDQVFVDGLATNDSITVSVDGAATNGLRVSGLPYAIRITGSNTADRLTLRGNGGDDLLKTENPSGGGTASVEALIGITMAGGVGNDTLSADAILIGGVGNDQLIGGAGDDQLFGNDGDDTFVGGSGNDTIDGGTGTDTIWIAGTAGNDAIDVFQSSATNLQHTVNGDIQNDTLVLNGGSRTVERVYVDALGGADTIRIRWDDALGIDANLNALRMDVDGGDGPNQDRLGVVDVGTGDLILLEKGYADDSGTMTIGPSNSEPLVASFVHVETAQPIAAADGDVVVFKHDPFEYNDARTSSWYLGSGDAINVDPNINPGADPIFGFPADQDWYRVVAERTGVLDFQVYFRQVAVMPSGRPGLPGNGNLEISVTDAAGNAIAGFGANDATDNERIRIPAVAGQTYYLRVFANAGAINTYNITVDNYVPPVPANLELLDNPVGDPPPANSDTGRSQTDNITRDNTPTLVLRLDDGIFLNDLPGNDAGGNPPDELIPIPFQAAAGIAGYRVAIFDEGNSPAPGTQTGTAPQTPLGFATFVSPGIYQFTTPVLSDGSHFLTARVQMVDPANPQQTGFGARSAALEIVVDTVIPPGFFGQLNAADTTQGLDAASDSGVAGYPITFTDRVTSDTTPTVYGRAEADSIVRVYAERNGIAGLQSTGANPDLFLGLTVAVPLDGNNQFPGGQWSFTTALDLNNPAFGYAKDGLRILYATSEDVAGNVTTDGAADTLNLFLDTAGPQVTNVEITGSPLHNLFGIKPGDTNPVNGGPTPAVNSLTIRVRDLPNRSNVDPNFLYAALQQAVAATPGNIILQGDQVGIIAINTTQVVLVPSSDGNPANASIIISFSKPLPDDRYTLTLKDNIVDPVGNKLDGESNAAEPNGAPLFPTGDGQPGRDFVARFTVDSRPEVAVVSQGIIYADINGNGIWDPEGQDNDATNRDFVMQMGTLTDAHFAGNFAPAGAATASGFDKLGVYGKFGATYSFLIDTNDDGVGDTSAIMPAAYQVNGMPVAGNFNAAHPGDEIGLFDGQFWYLDVNGNNQIDLGERIASNFNGLPVVGDFNGDGSDDLAAYVNDTNLFYFDTNRDGNFDFIWEVRDQVKRFAGLSGFTDRPVAGDYNLDGVDDLGLWVKGRGGQLPTDSGEYFFWISDRKNANPSLVFDPFTPAPLGNDIFFQFGDETALPVFGNFDPPVADSSTGSTNYRLRIKNALDVDGSGYVSPIDALLVINSLNLHGVTNASPETGDVALDVDGSLLVSPLDALMVINHLNLQTRGGEGESAGDEAWLDAIASDTNRFQADEVDLAFATLDDFITSQRKRVR